MKSLSYTALLEEMSALGSKRTPFLFIVDYERREGFVWRDPLGAGLPSGVYFDFHGVTNTRGRLVSARTSPPGLTTHPLAFSDYERSFGIVRNALLRGDSFLCNLTMRTAIDTDATLEELYDASLAPYRLLLAGRFVCFSPECFVQISPTGVITTYPMKGTIDAQQPDAERLLLENAKEQAEHYTIVDLMRSDLSRVATNIHVQRYRYIEHIQTLSGALLQTSSEISGQLAAGWQGQLGQILDALLPAGSITGAPKQATCATIAAAEQVPRGYYTGVAGLFDGERLDSCVLIRFISASQEPGGLYFHSGGGITIHSTAQDEYNEMLAKVYLPIPCHISRVSDC